VPEASALGIDLGTTFSVVAPVNDAGLPTVLPNAEGSPTTPSVVLFEPGQAVVGVVARGALSTEPESVVPLVKRHIGSGWEFDYGGVCYRPEHVSALILRKLAQDAQLLAGPVTQAAITVPAYFNDPMRAATLRAPVSVTMSLNRDGILQVSAADVTSGAEASTTIVHADLAGSDDSAADQAVRALLVA
jgi:molecular chaperone DnaK